MGLIKFAIIFVRMALLEILNQKAAFQNALLLLPKQITQHMGLSQTENFVLRYVIVLILLNMLLLGPERVFHPALQDII